MEFGALRDVPPMVETCCLEEADDAYAAIRGDDVRFRSVVVP